MDGLVRERIHAAFVFRFVVVEDYATALGIERAIKAGQVNSFRRPSTNPNQPLTCLVADARLRHETDAATAVSGTRGSLLLCASRATRRWPETAWSRATSTCGRSCPWPAGPARGTDRAALDAAAPVLNSSQAGAAEDTWVLA